jgi:hypothetical protein
MSALDRWAEAFEADAAGRSELLKTVIRESELPPIVKERLEHRIDQTPMRKLGRKLAPRDAYDATPRIAQLCTSYETYHRLIESGASDREAETEARRLCEMSDEKFLELIRGGNSRVNPILRKKGTLRSRKSSVANIPGAISDE